LILCSYILSTDICTFYTMLVNPNMHVTVFATPCSIFYVYSILMFYFENSEKSIQKVKLQNLIYFLQSFSLQTRVQLCSTKIFQFSNVEEKSWRKTFFFFNKFMIKAKWEYVYSTVREWYLDSKKIPWLINKNPVGELWSELHRVEDERCFRF